LVCPHDQAQEQLGGPRLPFLPHTWQAIRDGFGPHRLILQRPTDLYELIINRRCVASFAITSNRAVDDWLALFHDLIVGNSAPDSPASASYQIVVGSSSKEPVIGSGCPRTGHCWDSGRCLTP
jgi:hypothetical protein